MLKCLPALLLATSLAVSARADRAFHFNYGANVKGIANAQRVQIWVPIPESNEHQDVKTGSRYFRRVPVVIKDATDHKYGNRLRYFELRPKPDGQFDDEFLFQFEYDVTRREVRALEKTGAGSRLSSAEKRVFLASNAMVPLTGKPLKLLPDFGSQDPISMARQIYDRVDTHIKYDKSKPGYGNGDVLWVCDSRFGNCTDFHSLFISLARSQGIPARFEIGFPPSAAW